MLHLFSQNLFVKENVEALNASRISRFFFALNSLSGAISSSSFPSFMTSSSVILLFLSSLIRFHDPIDHLLWILLSVFVGNTVTNQEITENCAIAFFFAHSFLFDLSYRNIVHVTFQVSITISSYPTSIFRYLTNRHLRNEMFWEERGKLRSLLISWTKVD